VSVLTSLIFGVAPALHAASRDIASSLRETGRSQTGGRAHAFLRKGLVVAEVALSLMLLVAAGLMIRTFVAMQQVDPGFRTDRVLTLRVPLPEQRYPDRDRRIAFFRELLDRVRTVPGVEAVGLNTGLHPIGNAGAPVEVIGAQPDTRAVVIHQISADYPRALGIRIVEGRLFEAREVDDRRQLAVVNEAFARTRMDGRPTSGQRIRIPRLRQPPFNVPDDSFEVVGVVGNTVNRGVTFEVLPEVYLPFTVTGLADRLVVLSSGDTAAIIKPTLAQVYGLDREQPATDVQTIDRLVQDIAYAGPRFNFVLFSLFAVIGLALSVIGVYGVMASSVAQQTRDVGVRMAIGASPGQVFRMVVGSGAALVAAGIAVGLAGSLLSASVLNQFVWRGATFDATTFALVSAVLLVTGLQACLWPARRAARISPVVALRQE
jgi:putative ABC transport system permease protein